MGSWMSRDRKGGGELEIEKCKLKIGPAITQNGLRGIEEDGWFG